MKQVYGFVILTAFLFGTMEVSLKIAGGNLDSFQLTFLRFAISGLMLLPFGLAEIHSSGVRLIWKDFVWLLLVGCMGIPLSMLCFQLGVERSAASTASVLICMNPMFTMIIAYFFAGEPMTRAKTTCFFVGIIALIFMIRPWDLQAGNTPAGMILMVISAVTFSMYTVMSKKSVARMGVMAQTSLSFLMGSAVLLVIILLMGRPVLQGVVENKWLVLYIGICVTGIGYWSYFMAIKRSDASTGSIAFLIKPAIAPVMAVLILGEHLAWNSIIGIILLLTASFINLRENQRISRQSQLRLRRRDLSGYGRDEETAPGQAAVQGAAGSAADETAGTDGAVGTNSAAGTNGAVGTNSAAGTNGAVGADSAAGTDSAAGAAGPEGLNSGGKESE
ncbi:MAG: DMT family transporter [Anaerovoracaceae bacterium]|jgi:drug/metabolite transporter (DMT)-like permease